MTEVQPITLGNMRENGVRSARARKGAGLARPCRPACMDVNFPVGGVHFRFGNQTRLRSLSAKKVQRGASSERAPAGPSVGALSVIALNAIFLHRSAPPYFTRRNFTRQFIPPTYKKFGKPA